MIATLLWKYSVTGFANNFSALKPVALWVAGFFMGKTPMPG
jgi:hypothetical protein